MTGAFDFDPDEQEYGVASRAIRSILTEWAEVDWYEPPADDDAADRALHLFREHHAVARATLPDVFPEHVEIRTVSGTWADFHRLADGLRAPGSGWDWKYSALKKLSLAHAEARGWSLQEQRPPLASQDSLRPGALFIRIRDAVVWGHVRPRLALRHVLSPADVTAAAWYTAYATLDFYDRIKWHLAEQSNDASGNPFTPLTRCYREGFYPFGLSPTEMVLFSFAR